MNARGASGLVLVIIGVAAALRLATLGQWSVWIDEAFTVHDAHHGLPSYPLGYLLVRLTVALFGTSEIAIRIGPCLFGIATIAWLAWPTAERARTERYRWAAVLLGLSSWHLFWSQSARYYAPQIFFIVAAVRVIESVGSRPGTDLRRWIAAATCLACALACHPSSAFFLPGAVGLAWPMLTRRARLALLATGAAAGMFTVYRYGPLFSIHREFKADSSTWQLLSAYGFQAGPIAAGSAVIGAWMAWRTKDRATRVGLWMGLVPGAVFVAASSVLFVTGYHAIATLPFTLLLAAYAPTRAPAKWRNAWLGLLIAEQLVGLGLYHTSHGMRPDYRTAAAVVRGEPAALVFAAQEAPLAYYLVDDRRYLREPPTIRFFDDYLLGDLADGIERSGSAWLVVHEDDLADWTATDLDRLSDLCGPGKHRTLPGSYGPKGLTLRLYRLTDTPTRAASKPEVRDDR